MTPSKLSYSGRYSPFIIADQSEAGVFYWQYSKGRHAGKFAVERLAFLGTNSPDDSRITDVAVLTLRDPVPIQESGEPLTSSGPYALQPLTVIGYQNDGSGYSLQEHACDTGVDVVQRTEVLTSAANILLPGIGYRAKCHLGPGGSGGVAISERGLEGIVASLADDGTNLIVSIDLALEISDAPSVERVFANLSESHTKWNEDIAQFFHGRASEGEFIIERYGKIFGSLANHDRDAFYKQNVSNLDVVFITLVLDQFEYTFGDKRPSVDEAQQYRKDFMKTILICQEISRNHVRRLQQVARTTREFVPQSAVAELKNYNAKISVIFDKYVSQVVAGQPVDFVVLQSDLTALVYLHASAGETVNQIWAKFGFMQFKKVDDLRANDPEIGIRGGDGVGIADSDAALAAGL